MRFRAPRAKPRRAASSSFFRVPADRGVRDVEVRGEREALERDAQLPVPLEERDRRARAAVLRVVAVELLGAVRQPVDEAVARARRRRVEQAHVLEVPVLRLVARADVPAADRRVVADAPLLGGVARVALLAEHVKVAVRRAQLDDVGERHAHRDVHAAEVAAVALARLEVLARVAARVVARVLLRRRADEVAAPWREERERGPQLHPRDPRGSRRTSAS